jgi:hypothetical protein
VKLQWLIIALATAAGCASSPKSNGVGECTDPFAGAGKIRFETDGWKTNFCKRSVELSDLKGGGPPRDGIPPIDAPKYVDVAEANNWIGDVEPVVVVEIGNEARIYPLQILTWHEVVNDTLGGTPIAVTFCPLCYAAIAFERPEVGGTILTFGTSGNLRNSDLVMWDRQTESWWQQFEGTAIVGELTGTELAQLPAAITSWKDAKAHHAKATVLSRDTGHRRPYGRNPYAGYDDVDKKPFLYEGRVGDGLAPMEHVVGVKIGDSARAYAYQTLQKVGAVNDTLGGQPIAIMWKAGTASALHADKIADGKDIGATGVFSRNLDGQTLSFEPLDVGAFRDVETGSLWTILGTAYGGPLTGKKLRALPRHDVFWFTWSAFAPDGKLYVP